jgi:hypothetical protein
MMPDRMAPADRVRAVAASVLAGDPDDRDADRADLAGLLAAIGEAWTCAANQHASIAEQFRWSTVCVIAQRIAQRWDTEIAETDAVISALANGEPGTGGVVTLLAHYRDEHRRGT